MGDNVLIYEQLKILGLGKNATLEEIQISFAYLYQMIDLAYPLNSDNSTEKQREEELKRLENAYLLALKCFKQDFIGILNCSDKKINNSIKDLLEIEAFISSNDDSDKETYQDDFVAQRWSNTKIFKPWLNISGKGYCVSHLSETEITITPPIPDINYETVKGELYYSDMDKVKIAGKVVNSDNNQTTIRLVTRIAKKLVQTYNLSAK